MSNRNAGEQAAFFVMGAAIGAAAALLLAPASGEKNRRKLAASGEEVADYLIGTGKELVEKCQDLCKQSGELAGDAAKQLAAKYRALHEQSQQLLEETEKMFRRVGKTAKSW